MTHYYLYLFLLLFCFQSCEIEAEDGDLGTKTIQLQLKVPESNVPINTRVSGESLSLRFIVELYKDNDENYYRRFVKMADNNTLNLEIQTPKESACKVVFWADYTSAENTLSTEEIKDLYFDTSKSLRHIEIKNKETIYSQQAYFRDAFSNTVDIPANSSGGSLSVELKRVTASLRIYTSDLNSYALINNSPNSTKVSIKVPSRFDAYTQIYGQEKHAWNFSSTFLPSDSEVLVHESYFFPAGTEGILETFSLEFFKDVSKINTVECSNIPVKRNYRTNIRGNLLTNSTNIDVSVDSNFESDEDGESEDPVLPEYEEITIEGGANSFILNPKSGNMIYHIPIDIQNEYYLRTNQLSKAIANEDCWKAKVVWTEIDALLEVSQDKYGENTFAVILKSGKQGNALIGIYKDTNSNSIQDADEPLLWSYHLWVTDYNPNEEINLFNDQTIYDVEGGKIHRIGDNELMMDRNLGNILIPTNPLIGQLCYQYGRKDPFPSITTGAMTSFVNQKIKIDQSMPNPLTLYGVKVENPYSYLWTDEKLSSNYEWSDSKGIAKSTFDPCPKGWKLPSKDLFSDLLRSENIVYTDDKITFNNEIIFKKQNYRRASNGDIGGQGFMYLTKEHNSSTNLAYGLGIDTKTKKPAIINLYYSSANTVRCIKE
ncbi:MAG: DUF6562 domain-containing protein [Bacteroidales bacterium]